MRSEHVATLQLTLQHFLVQLWKEEASKMSDVEDTIKRINSHKGVVGLMVINSEGIAIRTTLDNSTTLHYAALFHSLVHKARSTCRDMDPQNDLCFLRLRTKKHEIMLAPEKEYMLIVIQAPPDGSC